MNTTRLCFALAASLAAAPVLAETPAVNFDQAIDATAILAGSKIAAKSDVSVVAAQLMGGRRATVDCVTVSFGAADPAVSRSYELFSQEYIEQCWSLEGGNGGWQGGPGRGGNGGGRGGNGNWGGQPPRQCHEYPGQSYHENVSVEIRGRQPLLPWERDSFRVCLSGAWLSFDDVETAYDYRVVSGGNYNGAYVVAPGRKIAQRPDPVGVLGALDSSMKLTLTDKWASYYAGESISVKFKLKKSKDGWFDSVVAEGEINTPVAGSYAVDLSKSKLEAGKSYYVEYSIRRVGSVSKDSWTKSLQTNKIVRAQQSLALNK